PVFIFFLYLIIMFMKILPTGMSETDINSDLSWMSMMSVFVPFLIVMVLLQSAKKIAIDFSGKMGQMVAGAADKTLKLTAGIAGGVALGAATAGVGLASGATAIAGRATAGRLGAKLASSEKFSKI